MKCVFCDIVQGKDFQKWHIVYQDEKTTAFLDQLQVHPGHILVVPNRHHEDIYSLDEDLAGYLFKVTTKLAKVGRKAFRYEGLNIYQCNGKCAGQTVFHFHIHLFPRKGNDGFFRVYGGLSTRLIKKATKKNILAYRKKLKEQLW